MSLNAPVMSKAEATACPGIHNMPKFSLSGISEPGPIV
jgi:hypothetical protein